MDLFEDVIGKVKSLISQCKKEEDLWLKSELVNSARHIFSNLYGEYSLKKLNAFDKISKEVDSLFKNISADFGEFIKSEDNNDNILLKKYKNLYVDTLSLKRDVDQSIKRGERMLKE